MIGGYRLAHHEIGHGVLPVLEQWAAGSGISVQEFWLVLAIAIAEEEVWEMGSPTRCYLLRLLQLSNQDLGTRRDLEAPRYYPTGQIAAAAVLSLQDLVQEQALEYPLAAEPAVGAAAAAAVAAPLVAEDDLFLLSLLLSRLKIPQPPILRRSPPAEEAVHKK